MAKQSCLDALQDQYRLPDALKLEAYETISKSTRATFKQAMALWAWRWQNLNSSTSLTTQKTSLNLALGSANQNLSLNLTLRPLDFVVIILDGNYQAQARLMSLILLPTLCGVKNIQALILGTPSKEVCFTLELTGVEDAFLLPKDELKHFSESLPGFGGLISLTQIPHIDLPLIFKEEREPIICLDEPALFDLEQIHFFHGTHLEEHIRPETDLVFTSKTKAQELMHDKTLGPILCLTPGCEGYWHYPKLTAANFLIQQELITTS